MWKETQSLIQWGNDHGGVRQESSDETTGPETLSLLNHCNFTRQIVVGKLYKINFIFENFLQFFETREIDPFSRFLHNFHLH